MDISFTVCLFVFFCLSAGILVTDISGVGWRRAMKFCRMVVSVSGRSSPLWVDFGPGVSPPRGQNVKNFGNAYLVDRLRDRAEIL